MMLTSLQTLIIIFMVALGTMITRFLPFFLFANQKAKNPYIRFLGQVLPYSAIGLLVIYCLKHLRFDQFGHWLPEIIAIGFIVFIHYRKENVLLSIGSGTILYMFLIQYVFI